MAVEGINPNVGAPNFQGEEKKSGSIAFPVTLGVIGAGTGYFVGQPITAKKVLENDKFELSKDTKVTPEQEAIAAKIDAAAKKETINAKLKEAGFVDDNVKDIDAEKFAGKKADLEAENKTKNEKITELETKLKEEKNEETKKALQNEINEAKAKVAENESRLKLFKENGKITKEELTNHFKAQASEDIEKGLKSLKEQKIKLPKMHSVKNAIIFGLTGLAGGFILKGLFGSKKEAA